MNAYQKILYKAEQGIARITLNRPEKRNALDAELIAELQDAIERSAVDESIRLVAVRGAGKDFCSGMDLSVLQKSAKASVLENLADARKLAQLFIAMRRHPRPVVALVQGRALAGGCGLATAADMIVASKSAQFGYTEVNIGFVPAIVMAMLRRSMGEKRAFEWAVSGEIMPAQTAFDHGLVNRVFADDSFDAESAAFLLKLASKPPSGVMLSKRLLYHTDVMSFEAAIEAGVEINALARTTEDCQRGIERFLNKSNV